jgi:hypothetical protein
MLLLKIPVYPEQNDFEVDAKPAQIPDKNDRE